jgi:hypothetical protein
MKLILEVSDLERKEILEKHEFFKKVLTSKVNNKTLNEQTALSGVAFLKDARDKKCPITIGSVLKSAPGKPTILYKKADFNSKNGYFKVGDELYIKDDFTFDVVVTDENGNKQITYQNRKWSCPAITAPIEQQTKTNIDRTKLEGDWKTKEELLKQDTEQNILNPVMYETTTSNGVTLYRRKASSSIGSALTDDQQKIVNKWMTQGAKLRKELDPEEAKTWSSRVVSPSSEGYFSQDLIMYFPPENVVGSNGGKVEDEFKKAISSQTPTSKRDCKDTIEAYYQAYVTKKRIQPNTFEPMKEKVQACANEFNGKWGGVLSRIDDYVDILRGVKEGGPTSYGDDSKWRLQ